MSVRSRSSLQALLALITLIGSLVVSAVPASSVAVTGGELGGFEQDGNQAVDTTGNIDWASVSFNSPSPAVIALDDTLDSGFTQGSKELQPAGWACGTGGADPGKADILRAFANPRVSADKVYLDVAFIRKTANDTGGNGDVHVNFEFNQAAATPSACPLDRQEGDLLVTYDFPGGAGAPTIEAWMWDKGAGQGQDEGDWIDLNLTANQAKGAVNPGAMTDTVSNTLIAALGALGPQQFGEATLDLTDALTPKPGQAPCVSFGSLNVRSRSSGESWTSSLQDKLPSTPIDFSTCAKIELVKKTDGGQVLAGAKFNLYLDADKDGLDDQDAKVGGTCTTDALGKCVWDELSPGIYFVKEIEPPTGYSLDDDPIVGPIDLKARQTVKIDGTTDVDGVAGLDGFENYKWRYALNLSPEAWNLVGTDHVFTATLTVQKTAGGAFVAAGSETLGISLSGNGSIKTPGAGCTTNASGQCAITITSALAGDSTLSVAFDDKVTTATVDASDSEVKHWINYRIDIDPDATNYVGTAHTFTVTVERDSGSGFAPLAGAIPAIVKEDGPGTLSDNGCAAGTNAQGQCTIKLTSAQTGTTVVKATYAAVEENTSNTFSDTATKNWVEYDLIVTPDGVNHAGVPHDFTVRLVERINGQWVGMEDETVTLEWTGTGSIPAGSCETDGSGECEVRASSDVTGSGTLTARWGTTALHSGPVNLDDSAEKTWIDWDIAISPSGHTNIVTSDHVFTVTVRFDAGDGDGLEPLAGATPAIDLVGVGSVKDTDCDEGTEADGTCTVTITSDVVGDSTVTATWHAVHASSGVFEDLEASAVKHWADYAITVDPDGVNHAGDPHTFTVHLVGLVGGQLGNLAGETVELDWSGTGSIEPAESCVTDSAGKCEVVASSDVTGHGVLTARWGTEIDSGEVNVDDSAEKTWIDWDIAIAPDNKTNLVGTDHGFTVTVRFDDGSGSGLEPLEGAIPDIALAGKGFVKDSSCDEGTEADGTCTVTISSASPGDSTVTASWLAVEAGSRVSEPLNASAVKHWVDYRVVVEPDAVNLVGDDHVFTVTVSQDRGDGFAPVIGGDVDLSWSGSAGSAVTDVSPAGPTPLDSCTTDGDGQCRVTVSSSGALFGDLTATYSTGLDSGTHSFSSDAQKRWVNWGLSITPAEAENLVGTDHTFVVKVTHDAGTGGGMLPLAGVTPAITLSGRGSIVANSCATGTATDGTCTVTITSAETGTSTVSAAFGATIDQASVDLTASGRKLWVDYRLVVSPRTAVNPTDTTHTFTVTLEKDTGSGFAPAPNETISLGLTGPGSIINVDAGLIASLTGGNCTTDAAGTCRVTITSPIGGVAVLEAGYGAVVGETSRTFTDDGEKIWVAPVVLGAVELPRTGSAVLALTRLALALLAAGFALHVATRRRRDDMPSGS